MMNLIFAAQSSGSGTYQSFAGIVYLLAVFYLWMLCFSIYKHQLTINFLSKDKVLYRYLTVILSFHVILSVAAVALYSIDFISRTAMLLPLAHWMFTIPAISSLIAFWHFRHGNIAEIPGNITHHRNYGILLGIFCGVTLLGASFGLELIWPVDIEMSQSQTELLEEENALLIFLGIAMLAPFIEEIIFRLGIQTSLERLCKLLRWSPIHAVGFTSLIFAICHGGNVEPIGFKETQIFITGLVFGMLKLKYGFYSCLASHLTLNGMIVTSHLLFNL